jgi:serine/threonine-protein kinase HipA
MSVASDFDLTSIEAANTILQIVAVVNDWQAHFRAAGVTRADARELAAFIDAPNLLTQRQSFAIDPYLNGGKPRRSLGAKVFR